MIEHRDGVFYLATQNTSYWFEITKFGHLRHLHYGALLTPQNPSALRLKRTVLAGSSIFYDPSDKHYVTDLLPLEYSSIGQGDYRMSPVQVLSATTGYDFDPVYVSHRVIDGCYPAEALPVASGDAETLEVVLADELAGIELTLVYTIFAETDVIARRVVVRNTGAEKATIEKIASLQLDLNGEGMRLRTFSGAWIAETHAHTRALTPGVHSIGSTTGDSSNRHNPGFLLLEAGAGEDTGRVWGVNLVYSGSHETSVELDAQNLARVMTGIQPQAFAWVLEPGASFETPQAILSFSDEGCNGLSDRFHRFVNAHIVPAHYREKPRPIAFNSWEALMFDINEKRLGKLAKQAASLGMELFVIDDGWFVGRGDDTAGLGDWQLDRAKFPGGLDGFAKRLTGLGLELGLWFEPEMVNENSALYRAHPDWVLRVPGKKPREGRQQLVLDLCNPDVCDFIVDSVGAVLDSADIRYVKWDMNRHIADAYSPHLAHPGMVVHTYMQNLYRVLARIFDDRPHVLLEMCSSGGNRFDLGMLRFAAMIWSSDDTDPVERLEIQQGLSYLYPPSVISAHVSDAPHQQTLRNTPLSTRFNVAAFGCLGYEYDLDLLTAEERKEIKDQIVFYKQHRELLQFGRFRRGEVLDRDKYRWQTGTDDTAIVGHFQRRADAAPAPDTLPIVGLDPESEFIVRAKPQRLMIERFGNLINHISPVRVNPRGSVVSTVGKYYSLRDGVEEYCGTGALLAEGIRLEQQFQGSGYNENVRMLGDGGSTLYVATQHPMGEQS